MLTTERILRKTLNGKQYSYPINEADTVIPHPTRELEGVITAS
jgi:hypothetical protein